MQEPQINKIIIYECKTTGFYAIDVADYTGLTQYKDLNENAVQDMIKLYSTQGYKVEDTRDKKEPEPMADWQLFKKDILSIPHKLRIEEAKMVANVRKDTAIEQRIAELKEKLLHGVLNEMSEPRKKYPDSVLVRIEVEKRIQKLTEMETLYSKIYTEVDSEKDSDGKKRFSNDQARKSEVAVRMENHPGYKLTKQNLIQEVASEMEDPKPVYTSADAREIEATKRLKLLPEYQQLMTDKESYTCTIQDKKLEIDFLKRTLKSYELVIQLMQLEQA